MDKDSIVIREGKIVTSKKRTLIFLNIIISCIASTMLTTAFTTALPPIMKEYKIDFNTGQWLTSGFQLFIAIITPLTAYLISSIRTKILYCSALSFFIVGLTVCVLSPNFWIMMMGRIIQGCGNGLISAMGQVIILTIYPPEKRGTVMGWFGLSVGFAPIVAPTLAGVLVDYIGWRMIFVVSIVIMLVSLGCAIFVFEDILPNIKKTFDIASLLMSALAFGGITLAIGNMGKFKFVSVQVLLLLVVGLTFSVLFVLRQFHLKNPFLDIRVLKDFQLSVSIVSNILIQLFLLGSAIIFPIYVQELKNKSATISGLVILPGSLIMAFTGPIAGKIYDKMGIKILYLVGSSVLIVTHFSLFLINIHTSIWLVATIQAFRCLALGLIFTPIMTWGMANIPKTKTSDATALLNSLRNLGGAIGSALFVSIMTEVAHTLGSSKENPEMYGFNIVFLTMTGLSFILLFFGIFKSDSRTIKSTKLTQEINDQNHPKKTSSIDEISDITTPSMENTLCGSVRPLINYKDKESYSDFDITINEH